MFRQREQNKILCTDLDKIQITDEFQGSIFSVRFCDSQEGFNLSPSSCSPLRILAVSWAFNKMQAAKNSLLFRSVQPLHDIHKKYCTCSLITVSVSSVNVRLALVTINLRFKIITDVALINQIFWVVTPCRLINSFRRFGGLCVQDQSVLGLPDSDADKLPLTLLCQQSFLLKIKNYVRVGGFC